MIRALIVDDEQPARERLSRLLGEFPEVDVAGEAVDGPHAMEQIAALQPAVVFLDIQMPGCTGLEVAASLPEPRPHIVFCTAFDEYAVDAFELHAVDYLLKPVSRARLEKALARIRHPPADTSGLDRLAVDARAAADIRSIVPFLLYLVLITFAPVYHGTRVLATRHAPETLRTPFHTAINVTAVAGSAVMLTMGLWQGPLVFAALSPIGALIGWGGLRFARRPYPTPMAWWYEHMGSMIGGGIAFHTAFLVLGAGRMLGIEIAGVYAIIPWLLPTIIGIPASSIWVRYYKRKFREDEATIPEGAGVVVH